MSNWTLNRPPYMSGVEGTSQTRKAVATNRGWENPVTGEVLVSIRGLASKAGGGDIAYVNWGVTPAAGGVASLVVNFNEKVNVTSGAYITVRSMLKASAFLVASTTATFAAGDTITVGTGTEAKTFTGLASLTYGTAANSFLLGATAQGSLSNFMLALNATGNAVATTSTTATAHYGMSTTVHATVAGISITSTTSGGSITATATNFAPANNTTLAIGSTTYTFVSTSAGVNAAGKVYAPGISVTNTLYNLSRAILAIDGLAPSSSLYIVAAAHPTVTCTLPTVTTINIASLTAGVENNIVLNTTSATMLLSGALLTGGQNKLKVTALVGGSNTSAVAKVTASPSITWTNIAGSVTDRVSAGSSTDIALYTAGGTTANQFAFLFGSDVSTTALWPLQAQTVSLTDTFLNGTIVDSADQTTSITTIAASVTTALGTTEVAYTVIP